jgi:lipopolysaccharide heptosyltransferase II
MRPREFDGEGVRSILVLRLYFLGDVLFATPVFEALRARFPAATIAALIKKRARGALEGNPHVDEIIEYDAVPRYHSPLWLGRLALDLRRRRFDLAVDLTGDQRSSWLLAASDPGFRVGINHVGLGLLLDRRIPYRSPGHIVDHLLTAVERVGATPRRRAPLLVITDDERLEGDRVLAEAGVDPSAPFIVVSPGAGSALRRWPAESFGQLAAAIAGAGAVRVVVTGSPTEIRLAEDVVTASGGSAVSLAGRTSVRGLAAVVGRAVAFVGGDSGALHVAASQGTPVVALFGPSSPVRKAPRGAPSRIVSAGVACSPCTERTCPVSPDGCMATIPVERVLEALGSLREEVDR